MNSCVSDFCIVKSSEKALSTSTQNLFFVLFNRYSV